jgi:hypothetical protein
MSARLTDEEVIQRLRDDGDAPIARARKTFAHFCGKIDQHLLQGGGPIETRRLEIEAVDAILACVDDPND